jgi:hypothetical protein
MPSFNPTAAHVVCLVGGVALGQDFSLGTLAFASPASFHEGFILIYSSPLLYKLTSATICSV